MVYEFSKHIGALCVIPGIDVATRTVWRNMASKCSFASPYTVLK